MPALTARGVEIAWSERGEGRPVLLIHETAAAGERERETLLFRDGQKPHSAPGVVFAASERSVTPGARHGNRNRHAHPHGFFH